MGIFRTLYREARDILGLKPAPENGTQRAERVCGEVKTDLGGKRQKNGDDYVLNTKVKERDVTIVFEAEPSRARIAIAVPAAEGVSWGVARDPMGTAEERGSGRSYVGSGIYVEGASPRELAQLEARWKALPTGARGVISQLLNKTGGALEVDDGVLAYSPEVETLADKSAKYTIKAQVPILLQVVEGIEASWT